MLSFKLLYKFYIVERKTCKQIGELLNITKSKIRRICKKYNIKLRNRKEAALLCRKFGKNNYHWKDSNNNLPHCLNCNIKLKDKRSKRCRSCSKTGKLSNLYRHGKGYEQYPLYFNKVLKEKIRNRDNNKCQHCNISKINHYVKYNRNLHVHHIDYNKENCKHSNLITLCTCCNCKANFNCDYWFAYYTYSMENK